MIEQQTTESPTSEIPITNKYKNIFWFLILLLIALASGTIGYFLGRQTQSINYSLIDENVIESSPAETTSPQPTTNVNVENTFTSQELGISFSLPPNWQTLYEPQNEILFLSDEKIELLESDMMPGKISLGFECMTGVDEDNQPETKTCSTSADSESVIETYANTYSTNFTKSEILVAGIPSQLLEGSGTLDTPSAGMYMKTVIVPIQNRLLLIKLYGTKNTVDIYSNNFENIYSSINRLD